MKIPIHHTLSAALLLFATVSCKDEDTGKPMVHPPGVGPTKSTGDPHEGEAPLPGAGNSVPPTGPGTSGGTGSGSGPRGDQPAR